MSRRSAYLALLIEHPPLLPRLAQLMGGSAWAADFLTRHPLLLDELLDARVLLAEPDWSVVADGARADARHACRRPGGADGRAAPLQARANVSPARPGSCGVAHRRARRRPPVRAGRHDPRGNARPGVGADLRRGVRAAAVRDRRLRQARAARNWAMSRTSTSCCSTRTTTSARRCGTRGSRSGWSRGSPASRPPVRSTTSTSGCGRTAPPACSCCPSRRFADTSAIKPGPGSTRH